MQYSTTRFTTTNTVARSWGGGGGGYAKRPAPVIKPSRPNPQKIALAAAPITRALSSQRINALEQIVKLAGEKPDDWVKPEFGTFDYWLARNCKWIGDEELQADTDVHEERRRRAIQTSHRFSARRFTWSEEPIHDEPEDTEEYVPQVGMKLVKDRNLTDSARRIAMFVMRHTYQSHRERRFIGMTVSFIMKGLQLSRRTVQRSLTLLETRGYFECEVAKGQSTRMCIGLIIHLLAPLFPKHHRKAWPERRIKPEASAMPQKHLKYITFSEIVCKTPRENCVSRMNWALQCMDGVTRTAIKLLHSANAPSINNHGTIPFQLPKPVRTGSFQEQARKRHLQKKQCTPTS